MTKHRGPLVLLVEDEQEVRRHLTRALRREGYQVEEVEDGQKAQVRFRAKLHPVVLLDLRLPKVQGGEVLRTIKELSPASQVVIRGRSGGIIRA